MKKFFALVLAFFAFSAHAVGPFDGIYNNGGTYWSVHQNGNTLIITSYVTLPASNIYVSSPIGTVYPNQLSTFDLFQGQISGSSATVSGWFFHYACTVSINISFNGSSLTRFVAQSSNTAVGNASNVNCPALANGTAVFNKLF